MGPFETYQNKLDTAEITPDPVQADAVKSLQRLYDEIIAMLAREEQGIFQKLKDIGKAKEENPRGIYMYGGVGRGKSMVMDMFFGTLPSAATKRRVHFHEFMIEVHDFVHEIRKNEKSAQGVDIALPLFAKKVAQEARILCFDEFHVTDIADAMILGRLFSALFDHGVVVITTSNWAPDDLYKDGLQRDRVFPFIDLLKERMEIIHLDNDTDYREQIFAQYAGKECSYFTPLNEQTHKMMDELFIYMTQGEVIEGRKLNIKGRELEIAKATDTVARVSFSQLCERPHGAEDYLKLAATFKTVFLEDIPKLTYDRRNEAKRLMTLVDALYDTGNIVIVSAAAPADQLYSGDDHAYEFERTVSRLLEMQSREMDWN